MAVSASVPQGSAACEKVFCPDLYSFKWAEFHFRLPLVSAAAVAVCLFAGVLAGHPGAGLIAGGGAFTVGFGANQRIADSRVIPMIAAVLGTSAATLAGTVAGHRDYGLLLAASVFGFLYGLLTTRNSGVAWVGQQSTVALLVASAFPTGPGPALVRAGLLAAGGVVQVLVTTAGLRLIPNLRRDLETMAAQILSTVRNEELTFVQRLRAFPAVFPALPAHEAFGYAVRLLISLLIGTEVYRRLGIQSGYWIPMTALLVQKPALGGTLARGVMRVSGTIAGAWLGSLFIAHVAPRPEILAACTALFALLAYATVAVNYSLFSLFLTSYIVFLLSLNQIPGPVIAHRRAWCTALGAAIALVIHVDALRRHRRKQEKVQEESAQKAA